MDKQVLEFFTMLLASSTAQQFHMCGFPWLGSGKGLFLQQLCKQCLAASCTLSRISKTLKQVRKFAADLSHPENKFLQLHSSNHSLMYQNQ